MVLCASILLGTTLKDVSYSIKQNGIMVNIDYSNQINDDDIIGWKSDRGWVYLTLLGVRSPKNKVPQQIFKDPVKKIVIDDFDESTQLAVLINKPVLGYDIINSKTSPTTVIFIHTEMKKSEVASLKKHIDEEGFSVFNVAKSSGFPKYNTNFRSAFDQARKELGPNSIFEYHGKLYTTNHPREKDSKLNSMLIKASEAKQAFEDSSRFASKSPEKDLKKRELEEIYIEKKTGDILTETISKPKLKKLILEKKTPLIVDNKNLLLSKADKIIKKKPNQIETKEASSLHFKQNKTAKVEKNIIVEKKQSFFKNFVQLLNRSKEKKSLPIQITENGSSYFNNEENYVKLQKKHIPEKLEKVDLQRDKIITINLSETQRPDTNVVEPLSLKENNFNSTSRYIKLQKEHVPDLLYETIPDTLVYGNIPEYNTQVSDTNVVEAWFTNEAIISDEYDATRLQKKYVPLYSDNRTLDTTRFTPYSGSSTQFSDTNVVEAWFTDDSFISDEYDATRLQKKYVPLYSDNRTLDTTRFTPYSGSSTQFSDTNVVEAWFTDDSFISDEYDATRLQKKYIPKRKKSQTFNKNDKSDYFLSMPQKPEFTDPEVLDNRYIIRYKNIELKKDQKSKKDEVFNKKNEHNTWLSFFPFQSDSNKKSLKWEFKREKEVPDFLQTERESLNYSSNDNDQYSWKESLSPSRPKSFPKRQTDPGFMYYHNSGINVEANIDGVPIYIDGKFVGETPLKRPVQVEPGWHQVSGFSPVYTQLAAQKGLQYVGYDPIIENNKLYGATTVYTETGKLETVELRFNQMGDTPKKWKEVSGGMNIGLPMIFFIFGFMTWGMG